MKVDLGDGIFREMDENLLEGPFFSVLDNDHEHTEAIEYRLNGKVVHRSVHVRLKEGIGIEGLPGLFGG
jgi:hypothetical protein